MPDDAAFCPGCGRSMRTETAETASEAPHPTIGKTGGLGDNIAGMLAYCTIIPAIIFLVLDPYNKNKFIRFHSFQSLLLWVAVAVVGIAVKLVFLILLLIPVLGPLLSVIAGAVLSVFWFII